MPDSNREWWEDFRQEQDALELLAASTEDTTKSVSVEDVMTDDDLQRLDEEHDEAADETDDDEDEE